jgi:predicted nucleic acid-binding protein
MQSPQYGTNVLVVDASVIAPAIADGGPDGDTCRMRIRQQSLAAPDLLRVEVLSVLRRQVIAGDLTKRQADDAVEDLLALPLTVYPTAPLLRRCWVLRGNVTAYDACYVALAEGLGCTLVTADAKLANAPGPRCRIDLI